MGTRVLFLTGFEPFLDVPVNVSGELARALDGELLNGVELRSFVLPVSFRETPVAYLSALNSVAGEEVVALCSLGVHGKPYFRLESRARAILDSKKPDADGVLPAELEPLGDQDRSTTVHLERLARALRDGGGQDVRVSQDAGGYLCERCYWDVLGESSARKIPGVFLHVPPLDALPVEQQLPVVKSFLLELLAQALD
ncbi:MAG: pyroglutamyl-peptidase [Candidatus Paceibacteria bacterium]|jgi:pyroglutamyl-peptidase